MLLTGEREGLCAWILANQLLQRSQNDNLIISNATQDVFKSGGKSAAIVEVGGASAQIVVEPPVSYVNKGSR